MTAATFVLVDGQPATSISVLDRGLIYGDGVFRTIRLQAGQALWWPEQIAKLAADAARLGIACPPAEVWQQDVAQAAKQWPTAALKLVLTRGSGDRGYAPPQAAVPSRLVVAGPLPAWPAALWEAGIEARLCELRLARQPRLAGIKHLNRLENVLARAEWDDPALQEGLLLDQAGQVICGVSSNVFIYRDNELLTPRLDQCGIAGVARARLMARAAAYGLPVREAEFDLTALLAADEVLLTNSLIGVWRVAKLGRHVWPQPVIYPVVREFLHA